MKLLKKGNILIGNHPHIESFLSKHGFSESDYIVFNMDIFKKTKYNGEVEKFLESSKPYYRKSKQHYLDREDITFNQFVTVLRQICKQNNIRYSSKVKYSNQSIR